MRMSRREAVAVAAVASGPSHRLLEQAVEPSGRESGGRIAVDRTEVNAAPGERLPDHDRGAPGSNGEHLRALHVHAVDRQLGVVGHGEIRDA
jgi:hypothetical protein